MKTLKVLVASPILLSLAFHVGCERSKVEVVAFDYGEAAVKSEAKAVPAPAMSFEEMFAQQDSDKDGVLDLREYLAVYGTPQAIEHRTGLFEILDQNVDGKLTQDEIRNCSSEANYRSLDSNNNGELSFGEFIAGEMPSASNRQIKAVLPLIDKNGDQLIQFDEYTGRPLEAWFIRLDANDDVCLSESEFDAGSKAFHLLDTNSDGSLSRVEFETRRPTFYFAMQDNDGDGKLSLAEYVAQSSDPAMIASASAVFKLLDKDGDGLLSDSEHASGSP